MRSLQGLTLGVVALALFLAASAAAVGPVTVTDTYTVGSATVPGVNTGLVVEAGRPVTVTATGTVCFSFSSLCYGPNGNPAQDTTVSGYGGFVSPGAPAWGLVGRVGAGPWVHVGSGPTTLAGTGVLVFAVNDDLFPDNRGTFSVSVSRSCWPGWGYGDKNHDHCGPPGLVDNPSAQSGNARSSDNGNRGGGEHGQGQGQSQEQGSGPARGRSGK